MSYGICPLSLIPVRAEASHRSEQVTQMLFINVYNTGTTTGLDKSTFEF